MCVRVTWLAQRLVLTAHWTSALPVCINLPCKIKLSFAIFCILAVVFHDWMDSHPSSIHLVLVQTKFCMIVSAQQSASQGRRPCHIPEAPRPILQHFLIVHAFNLFIGDVANESNGTRHIAELRFDKRPGNEWAQVFRCAGTQGGLAPATIISQLQSHFHLCGTTLFGYPPSGRFSSDDGQTVLDECVGERVTQILAENSLPPQWLAESCENACCHPTVRHVGEKGLTQVLLRAMVIS